MPDEIQEAQKRLMVEAMKVTRLGEKLTLARENFTDAATDEDIKRIELHRMEHHEIVDQLLDALLFVTKIKKQILDILMKSDPNDGPKT